MKNISTTSNTPPRRNFLKKSLISGIGLALGQTTNAASNEDVKEAINKQDNTITLLITSDIHAQIHTHDEFFWENNQPIYKKRGGLAVLKTMIEYYRKQNPINTIVYDGGDFFSWTRCFNIYRRRSTYSDFQPFRL